MKVICLSNKPDKKYRFSLKIRWGKKRKGNFYATEGYYIMSDSLSRVLVYAIRDITSPLKCILWGHDWDSQFYGYRCRNCGKEY